MRVTPGDLDHAREQLEANPAAHRAHLVMAAGYLTGAGLEGAAAACLIALDRMHPGHDLQIAGWRTEGQR